MDVFSEFEHLAQDLADRRIPYALIGGVAMAFHAQPRFILLEKLLASPQDQADSALLQRDE